MFRTTRSNKEEFPRFWRQYLQAHAHAGIRALHYVGTLVGFLSVIVVVKANPWMGLGWSLQPLYDREKSALRICGWNP